MSRIIENKLMDIVREMDTDKRKANTNSLSLNTPLNKDEDTRELIELIEQDGLVHKNLDIQHLIEYKDFVSKIYIKLNPKQR
ncbi:MAG: hypothetical protein ABIG42_00780, partial [bacterium]